MTKLEEVYEKYQKELEKLMELTNPLYPGNPIHSYRVSPPCPGLSENNYYGIDIVQQKAYI